MAVMHDTLELDISMALAQVGLLEARISALIKLLEMAIGEAEGRISELMIVEAKTPQRRPSADRRG